MPEKSKKTLKQVPAEEVVPVFDTETEKLTGFEVLEEAVPEEKPRTLAELLAPDVQPVDESRCDCGKSDLLTPETTHKICVISGEKNVYFVNKGDPECEKLTMKRIKKSSGR